VTRFIGLASGKGGVGKTTVAINLASALSSSGKEIILFDGNSHNPEIGLHLGMPDHLPNLHDVLKGKMHIKNTIYWHASGIKVVPYFHKDEPTNFPIEKAMIDLYGSSEIVLADTTSRHDDEVLANCDEAIIVTNRNLPAITAAKKALEKLEDNGTTVIGTILNDINAGHKANENAVESILGKKLIGKIPNDRKIVRSSSRFHPVTINYPFSKASNSFYKIAGLFR
jgi:septum site-determining protein MinD